MPGRPNLASRDVAKRNKLLLDGLGYTPDEVALNEGGRISERQKGAMRSQVGRLIFFFGALAVLLQTPGFVDHPGSSPILNLISGILMGIALLFWLFYMRAPHMLAPVRWAEGTLRVRPHEFGQIELIAGAASRVMVSLQVGEGEKAFIEGEEYRIYFWHWAGQGSLFLSAVAI